MSDKNYSLKVFAALAVGIFSAVSNLSAVVGYNTSFDTFTSNQSVSGQDGWDTNDPDNNATTSTGQFIGQSEFIKVISGYSATTGDKLAVLGGLLQPDVVPGQNSVSLYRPFDITVANGGNGGLFFSTNYAITDSATPYSTRDTFAFTFTNSAGVRVAAIRFAPPTTGNNLGIYLDRYAPADILSSSIITPSGLFQPYNSSPLFKLEVSIDVAGLLNAAITDSFGVKTAVFTNQSVATAGVPTQNIARVAATWNVTDTTSDNGGKVNAGSNALIFNNYNVVPEPSSVALLGIAGAAGLITMAKRRKSTGK